MPGEGDHTCRSASAALTGSQPQVAGLQAGALMRRCTLADLEREYILLALEWTEGKKTEAADLLQIDRKTLYRKLVSGAM